MDRSIRSNSLFVSDDDSSVSTEVSADYVFGLGNHMPDEDEDDRPLSHNVLRSLENLDEEDEGESLVIGPAGLLKRSR
ncbi:MAG TPA: hypothetical protein PLF31_03395 [Candidatus Paceibacterota bacterium]|nr:hypothetical protein [Candidatus Paceibacterota bacterium]